MWIKIAGIFCFTYGMMTANKLHHGVYRATLLLNEETGLELPFNFEVKYKGNKSQIIIQNAQEKITVEELEIKGDSVNFKMPVFDTEFKTKLVGQNLEGVWINHYRKEKNEIKFKAVFGEARRFLFEEGKLDPVFEGKWEVTFSPQSDNRSKAIGLFHHEELTDFLSGTFLTETGDYRYLEGMKHGNKLFLSCFDGSHAFLFTADFSDNQITNGKFYSGAHWEEPWIGVRNDTFKLRSAEEITYVIDKNAAINFSFPALSGMEVSLADKKFENKAVIIQVMGSWCPNCMDESAYLSDVYKQYKPQGLEIIALAFEKTDDFELAKKQVNRLKTKFGLEYEILITQQSGKEKALEVLPMFNKIIAFPTTIFLNKKHEVVKVHTGFSGPATGLNYEIFKKETEGLIKNLIKE